MKKKMKKIISLIMIAAVIASVCVIGTVSTGASGTGVGLAEWALNAYYSNWSYVYGGATPGAVDCSGLIYSYAGGYRVGDAQTFNSDYRGSMSGGIPNIHGLGLYQPGHVGVYVGNGMAVDARGDEYGVCYESVWSHGWTQYFKVPGVSYPDTGWVEFDGDYYYYENGEYLADTSRTIDGETYYFASSGKSSTSPSSASSSSSSSSSAASASSGSSDNSSSVLKKGSTGSAVEKLQKRLQELGFYASAVDGDFGEKTEAAFKLFQQAAGLYVDGIAGTDVEYLYADDAPAYKTQTEEKAEDKAAEEKAEEKEPELTNKKDELADTGAQSDAETAENASNEASDFTAQVQKVQERLIALGYLTGTADGEFGTMTEEAVKSFQTANGLTATGMIEQDTIDMLFSDSAVAAKKTEAEPEITNTANTPKTANEAPAVADSNNAAAVEAPAKTGSAPKTDVEKTNSEISAKSVTAVAESSLFKRGANGTNLDFVLWLGIMIVVLIVTFAIVYVIEKKRQKANRGRRYQ